MKQLLFSLWLMEPLLVVAGSAPRTRASKVTIEWLTEWVDACQCAPKILCVGIALQTHELMDLYGRLDIKSSFTGTYTPWPNRAEVVVRAATLFDMCAQLGLAPAPKGATARELLRTTATVRNSIVTFGGQTPVELVIGRAPRGIGRIENSSPAQVTTPSTPLDTADQALQTLALESE